MENLFTVRIRKIYLITVIAATYMAQAIEKMSEKSQHMNHILDPPDLK